jgi:uncharacterized protein YlxW (UPF0749 family)
MILETIGAVAAIAGAAAAYWKWKANRDTPEAVKAKEIKRLQDEYERLKKEISDESNALREAGTRHDMSDVLLHRATICELSTEAGGIRQRLIQFGAAPD